MEKSHLQELFEDEEEMKTRVIGQCKNCKIWDDQEDGYGECRAYYYRKIGLPPATTWKDFGCWYWKEKNGSTKGKTQKKENLISNQ